ncbi:MAG: flagellar hook-associated protein FlgK [Thermoguttaceae bacterium]|jgi:flagellar hook-associated protein 1 FlgK
MSLFGSIQMAGNALQANEIGLQVVGQNIANANTPGYLHEQVQLAPSTPQVLGNLVLGTGVQVQGITQDVDTFLQQRLRGAISNSSGSSTLQQTYSQLEQTLNALGSNGLSSQMTSFFDSIQNVLDQPTDLTARNGVVSQGQTLAQNINQTAQQAEQLRSDINAQVQGMGDQINQLTSQIASLNLSITSAQGGSSDKTAVGLTDQREQTLQSLSQLIDIQTVYQPDGAVNVYSGGDYLVYDGAAQKVDVQSSSDGSMTLDNLYFANSNTELQPTSGQLQGLLASRDKVLGGQGGFLDQLNSFANTLAFEFNKVYSSGQGLSGFTQMTAQSAVSDPAAALNAAGLQNAPVNGSFQVQVYDTTAGATQTTDVAVHLSGQGQQTTLDDLASALSQVSGLSANVTADGRLTVSSTSPSTQQFSFANDTSGVLAALGLNTFFTGSNADDLAVNQDAVQDPGKFAASQGGIGADTANAVQLSNFLTQPLTSQNGSSISDLSDQIVSNVAQASATAGATATGDSTFQTTLQNQQMAVSGVSIDDETIAMLGYQQAYSAEARFISTLNQLFQTLLTL